MCAFTTMFTDTEHMFLGLLVVVNFELHGRGRFCMGSVQ